MNKYIGLVILPLAQVFTFVIVYEVAWGIGLFLLPETRRDLFWGVTVRLAAMIFAAISFMGALLGHILQRRILIVHGLSLVAFSLFFAGHITYRPYRVMLLLVCGAIGFLVPVLLLKERAKGHGRI